MHIYMFIYKHIYIYAHIHDTHRDAELVRPAVAIGWTSEYHLYLTQSRYVCIYVYSVCVCVCVFDVEIDVESVYVCDQHTHTHIPALSEVEVTLLMWR